MSVIDPLRTSAHDGMLSGVDASQRNKLLFLLVGITGLAIAIVASWLAITIGDPIGPLFRHVLTVQLVGALVLWFALAWAARRLTIGGLPKFNINSRPAIFWGGFRVALLIATISVILGWCLSMLLGLDVATAFLRALVLLLVVGAFTAILGGAVVNSVITVKHWRTGRP